MSGKNGNGQWKNRIVGYGMESPEQLLGNPLNARIHPAKQQAALAGSLNEVGYVQGCIVNKWTSRKWKKGDRNVETMVGGRRNIVERSIGWLKESRRICSRFEKTAQNFGGFLKIVFIHRYLRIATNS